MTNVAGLPYLNDQIDEALSRLDSVVTVAKEFMRDQTISLEDRWGVYLKIENMLPIEPYMSDALHVLTDSPYDDLYMERRETHTYSYIDERIVENYDPDQPEDPFDKYQERAKRLYEKRDEFREAVLASEYGAVTYDW